MSDRAIPERDDELRTQVVDWLRPRPFRPNGSPPSTPTTSRRCGPHANSSTPATGGSGWARPAGTSRTGRSSTAASASTRCGPPSSTGRWASTKCPAPTIPWASTWPRLSCSGEPRTSVGGSSPRSRTSERPGCSSSPNRVRARISPGSRRGQYATATRGSSTARRCGRATPSDRNGGSSWRAPIPTCRSTTASACSSSTCRSPASTSGPCAR